MMALGSVYHQLHMLLPSRFGQVLKSFRLFRALRDRYDPLKDADYCWRLRGPLAGYVFKICPSEPHAQYVLSRPSFEPRVCAAIERVVQPGWVCADVGANIGYLTLLMARCCGPTGKVYAFEPLPSNAELLRENMALNNLAERVIVEDLAISDGSANRLFLYTGDSTTEWSLLPRVGHTGGIEVLAVTLDNYFAGGGQLDFVKMDIEGAEGQAVRGMYHLLHNQRPTCLIEIHGEPGLPALSELISAGYTVFDLNDYPVSPSDVGPKLISHILARPPQGGR